MFFRLFSEIISASRGAFSSLCNYSTTHDFILATRPPFRSASRLGPRSKVAGKRLGIKKGDGKQHRCISSCYTACCRRSRARRQRNRSTERHRLLSGPQRGNRTRFHALFSRQGTSEVRTRRIESKQSLRLESKTRDDESEKIRQRHIRAKHSEIRFSRMT